MQNCCLAHGKAVGNLLQSFLRFIQLGEKLLDALNDVRNLKVAINAALNCPEKPEVQGCLVYTISPVHTNDTFVKLAKELSTDESPGFVNGVLGQVMLVTPQIRAAANALRPEQPQ